MLQKLIGQVLFGVLNCIDFRYTWARKNFGEWIERLRITSLNLMGARIALGSYVRKDCFITNPSLLKMGKRSKIGIRSEMYLYTDFVIGNDVEIGSGLIVHTSEHHFANPDECLAKQGAKYSRVTIQDDVYIGSRVTILSGVTIGTRTVIGAGSVVTKDLEGGYIYAGVPAKKIGELVHGTII